MIGCADVPIDYQALKESVTYLENISHVIEPVCFSYPPVESSKGRSQKKVNTLWILTATYLSHTKQDLIGSVCPSKLVDQRNDIELTLRYR